jgi:CO/xanthine dehydrogenase FAD-binding subunit
MKPAPFEYVAASCIEGALARLRDEDAKALAGGQSLVPLLNFRLARPALLVDLNPIAELAYLRRSGGVLRIGALTRQATLERSAVVARGWPLLAQAVRMVGHPAIRSRGTVGGSVAHADPSAELPVALAALDASFHLRSAAGERTIGAADLFRGAMTTSIAADELLIEIEVPAVPPGARMAFVEHARTHGDFAIAGAALVLAPGEHAALALLGAGAVPIRAGAAERALLAGATDYEVAELAGAELGDEFRHALVAALVTQALERARQ